MTAATITQLPTVRETQAPLAGGQLVRPIIPRTYQEVAAMAKATCAAGIARKYGNEPSMVAAIMMSGMELGLKPLAALRLFYMTPEGQPALSARGMLAVVQSSGLLELYSDHTTGEGDERTAVVTVKRRGLPGIVRRFSMGDAKKAGLLSKQNWTKYADRMLWNRAVSFALNDLFADVLGGIYEPSELGGPVIDDQGRVIEPFEGIEAPRVAQVEVLMPGDASPEYFPQTKAGLAELMLFLTDRVEEGVFGIVLINTELLDRLAKAGYADQVANLREATRKALSGEDEDTADADETDAAQ